MCINSILLLLVFDILVRLSIKIASCFCGFISIHVLFNITKSNYENLILTKYINDYAKTEQLYRNHHNIIHIIHIVII
jgi:hypothetical protein